LVSYLWCYLVHSKMLYIHRNAAMYCLIIRNSSLLGVAEYKGPSIDDFDRQQVVLLFFTNLTSLTFSSYTANIFSTSALSAIYFLQFLDLL
jgi:hypothetical protein